MIWTDAAQWLPPRPVARATLVLGALPAAVWWLAPWKLLIKTTIDEMPPPGAQTTQLGEFTSHIHQPAVLRGWRPCPTGHGFCGWTISMPRWVRSCASG